MIDLRFEFIHNQHQSKDRLNYLLKLRCDSKDYVELRKNMEG